MDRASFAAEWLVASRMTTLPHTIPEHRSRLSVAKRSPGLVGALDLTNPSHSQLSGVGFPRSTIVLARFCCLLRMPQSPATNSTPCSGLDYSCVP